VIYTCAKCSTLWCCPQQHSISVDRRGCCRQARVTASALPRSTSWRISHPLVCSPYSAVSHTI
jgi:hypothetical protein